MVGFYLHSCPWIDFSMHEHLLAWIHSLEWVWLARDIMITTSGTMLNESLISPQEHSLYDPTHCHAFQYDITSPSSELLPFPPATIDIVILIFVLSAIQPEK